MSSQINRDFFRIPRILSQLIGLWPLQNDLVFWRLRWKYYYLSVTILLAFGIYYERLLYSAILSGITCYNFFSMPQMIPGFYYIILCIQILRKRTEYKVLLLSIKDWFAKGNIFLLAHYNIIRNNAYFK